MAGSYTDSYAKTVAHLYDMSMEEYAQLVGEGKRTDWLRNWPGQVVLGVSQTFWTSETTKALKEGGVEGLENTATSYRVILEI